MGSTFGSTPTFELFRRGLEPRIIQKFRGINTYQSLTELRPDFARDCLNVIAPGWGGLSKLRLPVIISNTVGGIVTGPNFFFDFQQSNGTRQIVANLVNSLYYFTWTGGVFLNAGVLIENVASDAPPWSMVEANNILFATNTQKMKKWTGANWWNWGIAAPTAFLFLNSWQSVVTLTRAANVVTITYPGPTTNLYFNVGDSITILTCPGDPTFVGTFTIASEVAPGASYTWAQVAANSGPFAGTLTATTASGNIRGVTAVRSGNVTTYTMPGTGIYFSGSMQQLGFVGTTQNISGFADTTFNGNFLVLSAVFVTSGSTVYITSFTVTQDGPNVTPAGTGVLNTGITITTSRTYAMAYYNSTTGHMGNIGPTTTIPGPLTNRVVLMSGPASTDPQVDGIAYFSTLDGGGNLYLNAILTTPSFESQFIDFKSDGNLNTLIQGPLLNGLPPLGNYLAVGQSRVFVANLVGASNQIAYSGYEQILIGRPEESFPPSNRLILQIGAESIFGIGILPAGVVAFSATNRMYMLRGNVEDITLSAPIQFSAYLQELPWKIGTLCHNSIQATPYGLIFLATDKTVQIFDGYSTLTDLSRPVYPTLQRMTKGFESLAKGAFFNWLNLDMYALTFPIDGSTVNNYTLFWILNKETSEIDIFPCNIPMTCVGTVTDPTFQRYLVIGNNGNLLNLPVSQDTTGGIGSTTIIPPTGGSLTAFWKSGYAGNESAQRSEMFRWARLIADQTITGSPPSYSMGFALVNDTNFLLTNPFLIGPNVMTGSRVGINQRASRLSVEIDFPTADSSNNVLELQINSIPTSDR
jgi:hypothetical protein